MGRRKPRNTNLGRKKGNKHSPSTSNNWDRRMLDESPFGDNSYSRFQIGPGYKAPSFEGSSNYLESLSRSKKHQRLKREQRQFSGKGRRNGLSQHQNNRNFHFDDFEGLLRQRLEEVEDLSRKRTRDGSQKYGDEASGGPAYEWYDQPATKKQKVSENSSVVTDKPVNPERIWEELGCEKVKFTYKLKEDNGAKSATIHKTQSRKMRDDTVKNLNTLRALMDDQLDRFEYIRWYKDGKGSYNGIFDGSRDEEIDEKWFHLISAAIDRQSDFKVDSRKPSASLADDDFKSSGLFDPVDGKDQHSSFYHNSNLLTKEVRENGGNYGGTGIEKIFNGLSPQNPGRRHNKAKLDQNVRVGATLLDWRKWGSGKDELFMTAHTEDFIRYDSGLDPEHKVFEYQEDKVLPDGSVIPAASKTFTYMDGQKRDRVDTDAVFYLVPGLNEPGGHTGAIKGLSSDEEKAQNGELSFKTKGQGPFHSQRHDQLLDETNALRSVMATAAFTLERMMSPKQVGSFAGQGYFLNSRQYGDLNQKDNQDRLANSLSTYRPLVAHRLTLLRDKYNSLSNEDQYELPPKVLELADLNEEPDLEFAGKTIKGMVAALWRDAPHPVEQMGRD